MLRTAEGFLRGGVGQRERLANDIGPLASAPVQVNSSWRVLAMVFGRTLGCVLMMVGSGVHYAVSAWATASQIALGFTDLLVLVGIALLVDPWDLLADTVWPMLQRITGDGPYEPIRWNRSVPAGVRPLLVPVGAVEAVDVVGGIL